MTDNKKGENTNKKVALLLTGGGARAAYQVGVLKALAQHYPRNSKIPFEIICGTSAGAINATGMACYASCFHLGVKKLSGSGAIFIPIKCTTLIIYVWAGICYVVF